MTRFVIDSHVWVWAIYEPGKLPAANRRRIAGADTVMIPSVSIYEIGQKIRFAHWPEMDAGRLDALINDARGRFEIVPLSIEIARRASLMAWGHRDPFDRVIASTALDLDVPLISRDLAFDGCDGLTRVWED